MSDPPCKPTRTLREFRVITLFMRLAILLVSLVALAQTNVVGQTIDGKKPDTGQVNPLPPLFLPAVTYETGSGSLNAAPSTLVIADVDGDGKLDVVATNEGGGTNGEGSVVVLLGRGDGTLGPVMTYDSGGRVATSVVVADINGDHKPDLVVSNCGPSNVDACKTGTAVVGVLVGNGDGTFQPVVVYESGWQGTYSVAVADVNGDSKLDLLVAHLGGSDFGNGAVGVLLGNGDGTFRPAEIYQLVSGSTYSLAVGDVNGDGKPDLLVADTCVNPEQCTQGAVGVFLGNGDGSFQPEITYGSGGPFAFAIAKGDVNGDGKPDLLGTDGSSNKLGVLLGNGDGTFQPAVTYSSGSGAAWSLTLADVNADDKLDALVTHFFDGTLGVLLANGDGTFQSAITYDSGGSSPGSVAVGDLNGDGLPDVVISEREASGGVDHDEVGVMLHVGATTTHTTLASSLNPSIFGQLVPLTATVTSGSGTPKGTVIFFDGSTALGSATLASGSASISVGLAAGSHSITAVYQGSVKFNSSASAPVQQIVNSATSTTSLASSRNPGLVNQSVTYTAGITSQYGGVATGVVNFFESGSLIAIVDVSGNQATLTKKYKSIGVHAISATYSGDANNQGSASPNLTEYIQATTQTGVTTSGTPSHSGQPVTFTATVTSKHGAVPNGELVKFYDSSKLLGSVAMAGGTAAFTTSTLSVATHTIKAKYAGDTFFTKSTGKVTEIVEP